MNWRIVVAGGMVAAALLLRNKPSTDTRMAAVVDAAGMYALAVLHDEAPPPAPKPQPDGSKPLGMPAVVAPPVATPTCTPGGCPLPQRAPVKRYYYQPAPPRLFPRLFGS